MLYCLFLKQVYFKKKYVNSKELKNFLIKNNYNIINYISNSGNFIFKSNEKINILYNKLNSLLYEYFHYDNLDIFIKNYDEIKNYIDHFIYEKLKDYYYQIFICNNDYSKILFNLFSNYELIDKEDFYLKNNVIYWKYLKKIQNNSNIYKLLSKNNIKHNFTLRTIGTLEKIFNTMNR